MCFKMEGELYLGFADAAPTCNLWSNEKKNPAVLEGDILWSILFASWFCERVILLTSQVFDIAVSGIPQRINYPLDRAGCARGRYCVVANKKSCLSL